MAFGFLGRWVFVFGTALALHLGVVRSNLWGVETVGLGPTVGTHGILAVGGGGWLASVAGVRSWLSGRGHLLAFTCSDSGPPSCSGRSRCSSGSAVSPACPA